MWWKNSLTLTYICAFTIHISQSKSTGKYSIEKQKDKTSQTLTNNNKIGRWPTRNNFGILPSNDDGSLNTLQTINVPSKILTNPLWDYLVSEYNSSLSALKANFHFPKISVNKTLSRPVSDDPPYIFTALSEVYSSIFPNSVLTTSALKKADPRTLVLGSVGIINGIIAVGAALAMSGVVFAGFLLLIKLAIAAILFTVGFIYVI